MHSKISNKVLMLVMVLCLYKREVHSFRCYIGSENQYMEYNCPECLDNNIGCLCVKAPSIMGREERFCIANPHNAKQPGCQMDYHQGISTELCLCNTELCNKGIKSIVYSIHLMILCLTMYSIIYYNI